MNFNPLAGILAALAILIVGGTVAVPQLEQYAHEIVMQQDLSNFRLEALDEQAVLGGQPMTAAAAEQVIQGMTISDGTTLTAQDSQGGVVVQAHRDDVDPSDVIQIVLK